jgi:hypothetical protein
MRPLARSNAWDQTQLPISQPIWGDGFLDLSLSTFWYPRSWVDVSDDELVLFLPSLVAADQAQQGAPVRIRNAFIRRLRASILILAPRDRLQAFNEIAETSAISGIESDGNLSDRNRRLLAPNTPLPIDARRVRVHPIGDLKLASLPASTGRSPRQ